MEENKNHRIYQYYFALLAISIAWRICHEPRWLFDGEMFAEMATNYFATARHPGNLFQLFFATDAGYIPLPQRLIALIGSLAGIPARGIPAFYTWVALVSTPALVGLFILKPFRSLVREDNARFFTALIVLLGLDFETRSFINFTYTALFVVMALVALILADENAVPHWIWILLPFAISKPFMLTMGPVMLCALIMKKNNSVRAFLGCFLFLLGIQFLRMILSFQEGVMISSRSSAHGLAYHLATAAVYFFVTIGQFTFDPVIWTHMVGRKALWIHGTSGAFFIGLLILNKEKRIKSIAWTALSVVLCTAVLNCTSFSSYWNLNFARENGVLINRHSINMFFACVLMVSALLSYWAETRWPLKLSGFPARFRVPSLFLLWFILSGAAVRSAFVSKYPGFPQSGISDWQRMAPLVEAGASPLCIPIDPYGWFYSPESVMLNTLPNPNNPFRKIEPNKKIEVLQPSGSAEDKIHAVGIVVRPKDGTVPRNVSIRFDLETKNGLETWNAYRLVKSTTVIMANAHKPLTGLRRAWISSAQPIEVLTNTKLDSSPRVIWLGEKER